jgi:hypothetical protein
MEAAIRFSSRVAELERNHSGPENEALIRDNATACIFTVVAALEAHANELYFQPETTFPKHDNSAIKGEWKRHIKKMSTLQKFQCALSLWGREPLIEGGRPFQDVDLLIDLRNALVHFTPAWESKKSEQHTNLSDRLKVKFTASRVFDGPIFPNGWATHGCTEWAIDSVLKFADYFERQAGYPLPSCFALAKT